VIDTQFESAGQTYFGPQLFVEDDQDEFRVVAGVPLECGPSVVCRAAADVETGGPVGRAAFPAPKRPPPRQGAIDTRRVLIRAIRDQVKARRANVTRLVYRRPQREGRRAPRRSQGTRAARASGDSGDGGGEPAARLAFSVLRPSGSPTPAAA
jgi:hypothetical protein